MKIREIDGNTVIAIEKGSFLWGAGIVTASGIIERKVTSSKLYRIDGQEVWLWSLDGLISDTDKTAITNAVDAAEKACYNVLSEVAGKDLNRIAKLLGAKLT